MLWSIDGTSPGGTEGGPEYIYSDEKCLSTDDLQYQESVKANTQGLIHR